MFIVYILVVSQKEYYTVFFLLQLTLRANNLEQASAVAQHNLTSLVLGGETDFFKSIWPNIAHAPDLSSELVIRTNRRGKAGLEFLDILGVAATKFAQDAMGGRVPAEEAVDDDTSKAHLLARLRSSMQRVIISVQTKNAY